MDHPPLEIVKQGIKSIQEYLREGLNLSENENEYDEFIDDVWASDAEDENKEQQQHPQQQQQRRQQLSRSPHNNSSLKYLRITKYPSIVFSIKKKNKLKFLSSLTIEIGNRLLSNFEYFSSTIVYTV